MESSINKISVLWKSRLVSKIAGTWAAFFLIHMNLSLSVSTTNLPVKLQPRDRHGRRSVFWSLEQTKEGIFPSEGMDGPKEMVLQHSKTEHNV